mgnify:CR=1 FL=1
MRKLNLSGPPAKGNAAFGRDGHTGEHPARVKCTGLKAGSCLMISGVARTGQGDAAPCGRITDNPPTTERKDVQTMTNQQYFKLEELKHKYNQKLMEAQEAHDEQESTYFSGVVNGIQIAVNELLSEE